MSADPEEIKQQIEQAALEHLKATNAKEALSHYAGS